MNKELMKISSEIDILASKVAKVFTTQEELDAYLKRNPDDKSKHSVKPKYTPAKGVGDKNQRFRKNE